MNISPKLKSLHSIAAYTFTELLVASTIALTVALAVVYIIVFVSKANAILIPQMSGQQASSRAMQVLSDLIRNAEYHTIVITGNTRIDFESLEDPGKTKRIDFTGSYIAYYPDVSNSGDFRILARGIETLSFSLVDQMIEIKIIFKYRKYKGYGKTEAEKLNGTFITRVFPRNA